jgi:hypothetical protein
MIFVVIVSRLSVLFLSDISDFLRKCLCAGNLVRSN